MTRSRPTARLGSEAPSESSASSSPERAVDDDTEDFFQQANDSQSSINVQPFREMSMSQDLERERRESPISALPPELIIAIFTKLNSTSDLLNCMLVSKTWAMNSVAILWHRPLCNTWKNLHNVVASVRKSDGFFQYYELVRRLNLSGLHEKISDGTVQPFAQCKRIERLTLTNCSKLTDQGVSGLLEGNKHLQALDVSDLDSLTDHTLFTVAKDCPRLQGLNITGCHKVTDESLMEISRRCRQIKRVRHLHFAPGSY
jgi:F-box and leucine-rich repeat protein GRR1